MSIYSVDPDFKVITRTLATAAGERIASLDIDFCDITFYDGSPVWLHRIAFPTYSGEAFNENNASAILSQTDIDYEIFRWTVASANAPSGVVNISTPLHSGTNNGANPRVLATGAATGGYLVTGDLHLELAGAGANTLDGLNIQLVLSNIPPAPAR